MPILRQENDQVVSTMIEIATYITKEVSKDSNLNLNPNVIISRNKELGEAILNGIYQNKLRELLSIYGSGKIQGYIRPKPDSWLSLINPISNNLSKFNLAPVNTDIANSLTSKLVSELKKYKNDILDKAKRYVFKVQNFVKKNQEVNEIIDNNISINLFSIIESYNILEEKGWFGKAFIDPVTDKTEVNFTLPDLENYDTDLEVKVILKDEILTLRNYQDVLNFVESALGAGTISNFKSLIHSTTVLDINSLITLVIALRNLLSKTERNSVRYNTLGTMINIVNVKLDVLKKQYDALVNTKTVIAAVRRLSKFSLDLFALEPVYKEYVDNGGKLKTIVGAAFSLPILKQAPLNTILRVNITLNQLVENRDFYDRIRDEIQNTIVLENKNNTINKMINYYIFGLDGVIPQELLTRYYQDIEKYLRQLSLSEITNIETTCLNVIKLIYKDGTNFELFINNAKEAEELLDVKDIDYLAAYATYKLVLQYLTTQTDIV